VTAPCRVRTQRCKALRSNCALLPCFGPAHSLFQPCPRTSDTPAPPVGLSALNPQPRQVHCSLSTWPSRSGPAGRLASASLRGRTLPRPGYVIPVRSPRPCASPPGPVGPEPSSTFSGTAAGCDRAGPALRTGDRAPAGSGPLSHVTYASRGARAAPRGPLRRRRRLGHNGSWEARGRRDLRRPPAPSRLGPAYAVVKEGAAVPRPWLAPQSGRPNTHGHSVLGPRANRCRRMNLPCRDSVSRAEIERQVD
jgi:hypothetical protein